LGLKKGWGVLRRVGMVEKWIEDNVPLMMGWSSVEKCKKMASLVSGDSLEIGVFAGRGLMSLGVVHLIKGGEVVGIDPWEVSASLEGGNGEVHDTWWSAVDYEKVYKSVLLNIRRHGLGGVCKVVRGRSLDCLWMFEDGKFGLVHQDGNHGEGVCLDEVRLYSSKVKDGGYWVMDDTDWESTVKGQEWLVGNGWVEEYVGEGGKWKVYKKSAPL
jgi:hypothetical protein